MIFLVLHGWGSIFRLCSWLAGQKMAAMFHNRKTRPTISSRNTVRRRFGGHLHAKRWHQAFHSVGTSGDWAHYLPDQDHGPNTASLSISSPPRSDITRDWSPDEALPRPRDPAVPGL
ncbi:hypothetical protein ACNKHS_11035 [Shigella flexneri]